LTQADTPEKPSFSKEGGSEPSISVIISHTRLSVVSTLESLSRQTLAPGRFEAIVVGSSPEQVQPERYPFRVRYLECLDPNPSTRRNMGMQDSRADIFAFLDDDAQATDNWLETGVALFMADEKLAVVGGPTLLPLNASLGDKLTYKISHAGFFGNGHENLKKDSTDFKTILGYIICCNMLVFHPRLEHEDGFNIQVGYGGEDTLFLYQVARNNNCRILYSTQLNVYHSRGKYGLGYLRSRFRYRVNNGMMIWACSRLYFQNRKFASGVVMGTALLCLTLFQPFLIVPIFLTHQFVSYLFSLRYWKEDWRLTLLFPPALFLQHLTYYAGVLVGFLSVFHPHQSNKVARIREALR